MVTENINRKETEMLTAVTPEQASKMIDVIDERLDVTPFGNPTRKDLMEAKMFYLSILVTESMAN